MANPAALAAALQAGVNPAQAQSIAAQRQFLAQMLARMGEVGGQNLRTPTALGANLLAEALLQRGMTRNNAASAQMQQQIAQALFPNDRQEQLAYLVAPDAMGKSLAARYAPLDVRQGNTVLNAPTPQGQFTAPVMRDDGGIYSTQTPTGVAVTGQRPANYAEQTGQRNAATQAAAQAEAARHNVSLENIDWSKIPIELGMMRAALSNAGTNAGQLGLGQANSQNFAPPPGFQLVPGAQ
jgi:hypothetical protein